MADVTGSSIVELDTHSLPQRLAGVGLGFVMTVLLFLIMQALIKSDTSPFTEAPIGRIVDFVPVLDDNPIETKVPKPPPPPVVNEQPPEVRKPDFDPRKASGWGEDISGVPKNPDIDIITGKYSTDGEYLPIAKVSPDYPRRAEIRRIEGYVVLSFTVTKTGKVIDPMVVESDPPGIFDRSAMNAAVKFKYRPRVVNGEPIAVSGVLNKFTFELSDE